MLEGMNPRADVPPTRLCPQRGRLLSLTWRLLCRPLGTTCLHHRSACTTVTHPRRPRPVLGRPDQHVAWRGDELPAAGAAAVLDIVLGHAAVAPGDAPSEGALVSAPAR